MPAFEAWPAPVPLLHTVTTHFWTGLKDLALRMFRLRARQKAFGLVSETDQSGEIGVPPSQTACYEERKGLTSRLISPK